MEKSRVLWLLVIITADKWATRRRDQSFAHTLLFTHVPLPPPHPLIEGPGSLSVLNPITNFDIVIFSYLHA